MGMWNTWRIDDLAGRAVAILSGSQVACERHAKECNAAAAANESALHYVALPVGGVPSDEAKPPRLDGCTCQPLRGSHRPGCAWAAQS